MWETWVWSLGRKDPLEKEKATHSSTLAWKIPWTEKPGRLQFIGLQSRTWLSDFTFIFTLEGGWSVFHLRKKSVWSGSDDHKEASGVDLLPFSPWRTRSVWVSQDTAASPPGSRGEEDILQGEWRVAPWAPPLSPALPLLWCPAPCLTTGTLLLESRSSCSPLTFQSCFHYLCSHHTQTTHRVWLGVVDIPGH